MSSPEIQPQSSQLPDRQPSDGWTPAAPAPEREGAPLPAAGLHGIAHDVLRGVLGVHAPASGDATRSALRRLCDAAHARGLRAEELLIVLKDAWRELPEARRAVRDDERTALSSAITLCIEEYYRMPRPQ